MAVAINVSFVNGDWLLRLTVALGQDVGNRVVGAGGRQVGVPRQVVGDPGRQADGHRSRLAHPADGHIIIHVVAQAVRNDDVCCAGRPAERYIAGNKIADLCSEDDAKVDRRGAGRVGLADRLVGCHRGRGGVMVIVSPEEATDCRQAGHRLPCRNHVAPSASVGLPEVVMVVVVPLAVALPMAVPSE